MKQKFGKWVVDESGIAFEINKGNIYYIDKIDLWKTSEYKGVLVRDWFLHLTGKDWFNKINFSDFVIAFVSAQDYLQQFKPNNSKPASIAQSIYIAQQFIEINAVSEEKNVDEIGVKLMDGMVDYLNKESNIKTLKIQ